MKSSEKTHWIHPEHNDVVRILQVTDSHIFAEEEGKLLGLETRESFERVLQYIQSSHQSIDCMLATGDLAQDASVNAYQYLLKQWQTLNYPCFWIAGNHDDYQTMQEELKGDNVYTAKQILTPKWQVVLLNTAIPGKVYGGLNQQEIDFLTQAQNAYPEKHLLVVLHHQPVPTGSDWLDNVGLKEPETLLSCVSHHAKQKVILWGHIHQEYDRIENNIRLLATPSTSVQFAQHSDQFAAGTEHPGYRILELYDNGQIETQVHRVEQPNYTVDYSIKGY